jgi:choline-sulfatase
MPRLLPLLLAFAVAACAPPAPPDLGPPPNVLLLVVDCLRADHLSANGYARQTTPSIDALAAEGVQFRQAISQASWTRPSLPTLLTGLYPTEHGLHTFGETATGEATSARLDDSVETVAESLKAAGYATAMIGEQFQLSPRFGLNQGFDFYKHRASDAANIHDNFLRWLGRIGEGPRFFAYLHYLEIHWPYCPPPETRGKFGSGKSERRFCHQWRKLRKDILAGEVVLNGKDRKAMKARYDEELFALDARLGDLFATLKKKDLWDDTLIILTGDHGEEFYEHGAIGHGQSLFQELISVPLIIKPPAIWPVAVGGFVDGNVELRNIPATILEATGLAPASDVKTGDLAAKSLVPWMVGSRDATDAFPYAVSESDDDVVIRSGTLKMIARRDASSVALYDLASDPGETHDLTSERRQDLARLRSYLEQWQKGLRPATASVAQEIDEETLEGLKALGYVDP